MSTILIIEDEKHTADTIALYLEKQGFDCLTAYDGQEGISCLLQHSIDLIILDWMLPGLSGIEVCQVAKSIRKVKIILLSARTSTSDKVSGLEVGADDYVSKPFSLRELHARIRMLLRDTASFEASQPTHPSERGITMSPTNVRFQNGVLSLSKESFAAYFNDREVPLTLTEFKILVLLAERLDRVLTKEEIAQALYGYDEMVQVHTITVHLSNLRMKLRGLTRSPMIKTVYGVGYKLDGVGDKSVSEG